MPKEKNDYGGVYINGTKIGIIKKPVTVKLADGCRISYAMTNPYRAPVFPDKRVTIGTVELELIN